MFLIGSMGFIVCEQTHFNRRNFPIPSQFKFNQCRPAAAMYPSRIGLDPNSQPIFLTTLDYSYRKSEYLRTNQYLKMHPKEEKLYVRDIYGLTWLRSNLVARMFVVPCPQCCASKYGTITFEDIVPLNSYRANVHSFMWAHRYRVFSVSKIFL